MGSDYTKPKQESEFPKFYVTAKEHESLLFTAQGAEGKPNSLDRLADIVVSEGKSALATLMKYKYESKKLKFNILDVLAIDGYLVILGTQREISEFCTALHKKKVTAFAVHDEYNTKFSVEFACGLPGNKYPGRVLLLIGPRNEIRNAYSPELSSLWVRSQGTIEVLKTLLTFDQYVTNLVARLIPGTEELAQHMKAERTLDTEAEDGSDTDAEIEMTPMQGSSQAANPNRDNDES